MIKECWKIYQDSTGQWTNKNKIDSLKLLKEAARTKFEILQQGPTNLLIQQMQEQLKEIVESNETGQKSFFVLPALEKPNKDMR